MSFYETVRDGVPYLSSDLLPCPHGFSTRLGGSSTLPHLASMNLGEHRGDAPENVAENYRRFCTAVGLPAKVAAGRQIHSATVQTLSKAEIATLPVGGTATELPPLDGFVTKEKGVTLCVKIADCLPLLLCDMEAGVICALHAGWRGSAAGIALQGVAAMCREGARPERIVVAIGPSIHPCCYEVGEDFAVEFRETLGRDTAARFLLPSPLPGKYYADLQGLNRHLLLEAGLLPAHIDISPECTCCGPHGRFFSHRASRGMRGTMAAMISLGSPAS